MDKFKNLDIKQTIFCAVKGALISVCISLICILVFAFIIKLTGMSDGLIKPINQVIKIVSIFIGTFLINKKQANKKLLNGVIVGLFYTIIAFIVFSILNGSFNADFTIIIDALFGGLIGAICGVICNFLSK